ncbi:unnamed protein product [Gordionus sp. m RMFG-2023]
MLNDSEIYFILSVLPEDSLTQFPCWINASSSSDIYTILPKARFVYQLLSPIFLSMGLVGNFLGAYVSSNNTEDPYWFTYWLDYLAQMGKNMRKKRYPGRPQGSSFSPPPQGYAQRYNTGEFLMRVFFTVNFFYVLSIAVAPIMQVYGDYKKHQVWASKAWITYITHFHNPLTKPLLAWSYSIFVILSLNEMVAISYPFRYRTIFTLKNVRRAMLVSFAYSVLWYLPTYFWRELTEHRLPCVIDMRSDFVQNRLATMYRDRLQGGTRILAINNRLYTRDTNSRYFTYLKTFYSYIIYVPPVRKNMHIWMAYQISREMFIKIIPFLSILAFRLISIRNKRKVNSKYEDMYNSSRLSLMSPPDRMNHRESKKDSPREERTRIGSIFTSTLPIEARDRETSVLSKTIKTSPGDNVKSLTNNVVREEKFSSIADNAPSGNVNKFHRRQEDRNKDDFEGKSKLKVPSIQLSVIYFDKRNQPAVTITSENTSQGETRKRSDENTLSPRASLIQLNDKRHSALYEKRKLEQLQSTRTLILLWIEFVVLLLPISMIEMSIDYLIERMIINNVYLSISISNMLEFFYMSFTFYFNFLLNPTYRCNVITKILKLFQFSE